MNPQNLVPFKKGQSGNPNGRPPGKSLTTLLIEALEGDDYAIIDKVEVLHPDGSPTGETVSVRFKAASGKVIIQALMKRAAMGDVRAAELIWDRLEGKVVQGLDITAIPNKPVYVLPDFEDLSKIKDKEALLELKSRINQRLGEIDMTVIVTGGDGLPDFELIVQDDETKKEIKKLINNCEQLGEND